MAKATKRKKQPEASMGVVALEPRLARIHAALAAVAVAVCAYLTYSHYQLHQKIAWSSFCDINQTVSCDTVALSPFGTLLGLPLATWGAWFYLLHIVGVVLGLRGARVVRSSALWLFIASVFSVLLSIALAAISAFVLQTWCLLCLALYALSAGMLVTSWLLLRKTGEGLRQAARLERRFLRRNQGGITLAATGSLAVLVLAAVIYPRGFAPVDGICQFLSQRAEDGAASQPAHIVVYSDFQCPYCKTAHRALRPAQSSPLVRLETRHYPLDPSCNPHVTQAMHPGACQQAFAAECAEEQGKLEAYATELFDNKSGDPATLAAIAQRVGLDAEAFEACLASERPAARVRADIDAAAKDRVTGTPSLFVEGRRILMPIDQQNLSCLRR